MVWVGRDRHYHPVPTQHFESTEAEPAALFCPFPCPVPQGLLNVCDKEIRAPPDTTHTGSSAFSPHLGALKVVLMLMQFGLSLILKGHNLLFREEGVTSGLSFPP